MFYCRGFQPVVCGPPRVHGEPPRGPRATPEKLETRPILTKQKYRPYQCCRYRLQRTELKTSLVFAMLCRLTRHVLVQPGVRKVEAGVPWAVGPATRAWNFCGVQSVTKVETSVLLKMTES